MAQVTCPACRFTLHYLEEFCRGPLSCPQCGNGLGRDAEAAAPPKPRPKEAAPTPEPAAEKAAPEPAVVPRAPDEAGPPPWEPEEAAAAPPGRARPGLDLSEPCVLSHVVWAMVNGVLAAVALHFVILGAMSGLDPSRLGWLFLVVSLLAWLFLGGFLRRLHALFWARPHLYVTPDGIDLRYWRPVNKLRPWLAMAERHIAWGELKGCRTYSHSTNGRTDWKCLLLDTPSGTSEVGWDIFATDIDELQQTILNYHERQVRRPLLRALREAAPPEVGPAPAPREAAPPAAKPERRPAGAPADQRARFATPVEVRWVGRQNRAAVITLSVLLGGALLATGATYVFLPGFACFGLPFLGFLTLALVLALVGGKFGAGGMRLLRISSAGLEMGDGPGQLTLIPWQRIEFTRVQHVTIDNCPMHKLQIHLRDGSQIDLPDGYDRSLEELAGLIDPDR